MILNDVILFYMMFLWKYSSFSSIPPLMYTHPKHINELQKVNVRIKYQIVSPAHIQFLISYVEHV